MESEKLGLGIHLYRKPENTQTVLNAIEDLLTSGTELSWMPSRIQSGDGYVVDTTFMIQCLLLVK